MNVGKELAALDRMTPKDLRAKYAEVFGEEARSGNKAWLVKRIAGPFDDRKFVRVHCRLA